jgi:signal transduction histidine kinase
VLITQAVANHPSARLKHFADPVLRLPLPWKIAGAHACIALAAIIGLMVFDIHPSTAVATGRNVFAAILVTGFCITLALAQFALRPIVHLEAVAHRVWQGDVDARVTMPRYADRDLIQLATTFNMLLDRFSAERARLRGLALDIVQARALERDALATELHESTAQSLAAIAFQINAAVRNCPDAAVRAQLIALSHLASELVEQVRLLSLTLRTDHPLPSFSETSMPTLPPQPHRHAG